MINYVNSILATDSASLTFSNRLELKTLGPPRPDLCISQVQNACKGKSNFTRKFNRSLYNHADWLCAYEIKNRFFCYSV